LFDFNQRRGLDIIELVVEVGVEAVMMAKRLCGRRKMRGLRLKVNANSSYNLELESNALTIQILWKTCILVAKRGDRFQRPSIGFPVEQK